MYDRDFLGNTVMFVLNSFTERGCDETMGCTVNDFFVFFFRPLPLSGVATMSRSRIIDLAHVFTPDALPDATLTRYPGLGPALEIHWLVPPVAGRYVLLMTDVF